MARNTKMTMILCAALAIGLRGAPSQQPAPKNNAKAKAPINSKPKPGVILGRVFAITNGGDIKPARLAKIYLLSWIDNTDDRKGSVAKTWNDELHKANVKYLQGLLIYLQELSANVAKVLSDARLCQMKLAPYDEAMTATFRWAMTRSDLPEIMTGNADEEGNFKFVGLEPGSYLVVAFGRAGFNEARWLDLGVTVKSDTEITLKLSSPEEACIVE